MSRQRRTDILEAAARANWRVFTLAELGEIGLTESEVRVMVDRGQLHRIHRGIYIYGHPDVPWQGAFLAAQRMAGEGAYLTRGSGLALAGLWRPFTRQIHVSARTCRRSRDGVIIHRRTTPIEPDEVRRLGPLRYAALPRLLVELAPASDERQLSALITRAVQQDKLDHALMRTILDRYAGDPGVGLLIAAYAGYLPQIPGASELERRFHRELRARPWIPEPQSNVRIEAGGIRWELDRYWPEFRVGVEIDSRTYHQALKDRAKDELKRAKLLTVGIQILSISDWRIEYDVADALDDLEKIIALCRATASV